MLTEQHLSRVRAALRSTAVAGLMAISLLLWLDRTSAAADPPSTPADAWITNGNVSAIALSASGTAYIGGNFDYVGPVTGGAAVVTDQGAVSSVPRVEGNVVATAPDGAGGWYLGGGFSTVGGVSRPNLVHVLSNGAVDTGWNPTPNGGVRAIAVSGSTVYVGGDFTSVSGQTRNELAAIDSAGNVTSWNPNANSSVHALAVSGSTIYVGGDFSSIGGQSRYNIAAVDAAGNVTNWHPGGVGSSNSVRALAVSGSTVYAGGAFTAMGGQSRPRLATIDSAGNVTAWNPSADGTVYALSVAGSTVYVGGGFTAVGGQARNYAAALDSAGNATTWNPDPDDEVRAVAATGSTVYLGGWFTSIGGQARDGIAAVSSSGSLTGWNPRSNSGASALAVSGSTISVVGGFTSIGGQTRNDLAEIDLTTGQATAWNPNANATWGVDAVAVSGSTVYVAGSFTSVGGQARNGLAALNSAGNATSWNPNPSAYSEALAVSGSTIYVGGNFTSIGGQTRNHFAAIDSAGSLLAWNPNTDGWGQALAVSGSTVYIGGTFSTVAGQPRNGIAAVDTAGNLLAWNPNANGYIRALAVSGSTVYAGGDFSSIGGQPRNFIAALNSAGAATAWNPNADSSVNALAVSGSTVYAGGRFSSVGGQTRSRLAALDSAGNATSWNPAPSGDVNALAASGSSVYAGGALAYIGGKWRYGFAAFIPPPANTVPPVLSGTPRVGQTLSTSNGTWTGNPTSYSYQWLRDGAPISGATSSTYTPTSADTARQVSARVTATGMAGTGAPATSNSVTVDGAPINEALPAISGTPREGQTLTASTGTWRASPTATYSYQWLRCSSTTLGSCSAISGATSPTYLAGSADVARWLRVEVTATNYVGATVATSNSVAVDGPPANDVLPAISGTPRQGDNLTASTGTWRASPAVSGYSYQWLRCTTTAQGSCASIAGATGTTYQAVQADVNKWLRVEVTATNSIGARTATSDAVGPVAATAPANTGAPTISGTARDGQVLTANDGTWSGTPPMSFSYQWRRCDTTAPASCSDISGATANTYTVTSADVGKYIRVKVTATNQGGSATAESGATAAVTAQPPSNTALPTISGTPRDGNLLSGTDGSWSGSAPITYTRQWLRCDTPSSCSPIAGATGVTYRLVSADVNKRIQFQVTASNAGGSQPALSAQTAVVTAIPLTNTQPPTISGTPRTDSTLTANPGTWLGSTPITFAYQWQRCLISCQDIPNATNSTYVPTLFDVGANLRVGVTATNPGGTAPIVFSGTTDAVQPAPPSLAPTNVQPPSVSGVARDGETLTGSRGVWTGSEPIAYTLWWQRCVAGSTPLSCAMIAPAAGQETYTLTSDDVGFQIRFQVLAANAVGSRGANSAPTVPVAAVPPTNTGPPQVVGVARVGFPLRGTAGTWEGSTPMPFTYRWVRCPASGPCEDIPGATADSYSPRAEDVGSRLLLRVTAQNAGGSASASSAQTSSVAA